MFKKFKKAFIDSFKNILSFKGRINPFEYFVFLCVFLIIYSLLVFIVKKMTNNEPGLYHILFIILLFLVGFIPSTTRRLHDRDKSGWWLFAVLFIGNMGPKVIAFVSVICFFVYLLLPSIPKNNRFGKYKK